MSMWNILKLKLNPVQPIEVKKAEEPFVSKEFIFEYIKIAAALDCTTDEALEQLEALENAYRSTSS